MNVTVIPVVIGALGTISKDLVNGLGELEILVAAPNNAAAVRPFTTHHETIQVRRTRCAGHCWRSKDELIGDKLMRTPSHGQAKAGRLVRIYIQQLCVDTGCSLEDQPEAMDDREGWWKWVWKIVLMARDDDDDDDDDESIINKFRKSR